MEIDRDAVLEFLRNTREPDDVTLLVGEAVLNYVDSDWEEEGYDNEEAWYQDFGRGEAETEVFDTILKELQAEFKFGDTDYFHDEERIGFSINEAIYEVYPDLRVI